MLGWRRQSFSSSGGTGAAEHSCCRSRDHIWRMRGLGIMKQPSGWGICCPKCDDAVRRYHRRNMTSNYLESDTSSRFPQIPEFEERAVFTKVGEEWIGSMLGGTRDTGGGRRASSHVGKPAVTSDQSYLIAYFKLSSKTTTNEQLQAPRLARWIGMTTQCCLQTGLMCGSFQ